MAKKSGRNTRLNLYDYGNTACPICLMSFTRERASSGKTVTLEHVPIKALGGQPRCLTCASCNNQAGGGIDQAAAIRAQDWVDVTANILGKQRTFKLSLEGKELTRPFAGFTHEDWRALDNTDSRSFTMTIMLPDKKAVAMSALKAAYLAVFSLLGPFGYSYISGNGLMPVRQLIIEPPNEDSDIYDYVIKVPDDGPLKDITLVGAPVPCWVVKAADHLVFLPLSGDSHIIQPLQPLRELSGGQPLTFPDIVSWPFTTFGAFGTVQAHLPGAETIQSLVGCKISGTTRGRPLEGICIDHSGAWATLLCRRQALGSL